MKTEARMTNVRILVVAAFLIVLCTSKSHAQCASVYADNGPDGNGNVHAWTILTDNYTNPGSNCAPQSWGNTGFTHTYHASLTVSSPSGRQATQSAGGSQSGGGGTSTVGDDVWLPIDGELGIFPITRQDDIVCSVAGLFYNSPVYDSFSPPPPGIYGVSDTSTGSTTIFAGDSGYLAIYGSALTAWGEDPYPTVTGDNGVTLSTYWASDPQVNASYTVDSQAPLGQHTLALQTKKGQAQGQYNVACPFPASESSQNGNWCPGCTGASFFAQLLDAGGKPKNGKYQGRTVTEANSNINDGCWWNESTQEKPTTFDGGFSWPVGSINTYGADGIYDPPEWVKYYQTVIRTGQHTYPGNTCSQTDTQAMSMNACRTGDPARQYESHTCSVSVDGSTTVIATRGNGSKSGLGPQ